MGQRYSLDTEEKRKNFLAEVMRQVADGKAPVVEFVTPTLSPHQFNAKWLWCEQVAACLNDSGFDMVEALEKLRGESGMPIPWTKTSVDERLYKPVLEAMTGKKHTGEQNKLEPSMVVDTLSRNVAERLGIVLPPFPSRGSI